MTADTAQAAHARALAEGLVVAAMAMRRLGGWQRVAAVATVHLAGVFVGVLSCLDEGTARRVATRILVGKETSE